MGKLHYLTVLLLIILLAIASGWIFDSFDKRTVVDKEELRHNPDYFLHNFSASVMNKKGKLAYQVKSVHLEHFPDDDTMELKQPVFTFYTDNLISWTGQSDAAIIYQQDKIIKLSGHVILQQTANSSKNPMLLNARQLTIEPERNRVTSKSFIKLTQGKNYIQSKGMRANLNQRKIEFLSKTSSHYSQPEKINIIADYLLFDEIKGLSEYKGNVLFSKETLKIKADSITLNHQNNKVTKGLIQGSPAEILHEPDNEAKVTSQARKMEYFVSQDRLELLGAASVTQGNRHFSGEHIIYDTRQHNITAGAIQSPLESVKSSAPETEPNQVLQQPNGRVHVIIGPEVNEESVSPENKDKIINE